MEQADRTVPVARRSSRHAVTATRLRSEPVRPRLLQFESRSSRDSVASRSVRVRARVVEFVAKLSTGSNFAAGHQRADRNIAALTALWIGPNAEITLSTKNGRLFRQASQLPPQPSQFFRCQSTASKLPICSAPALPTGFGCCRYRQSHSPSATQ